MKTRFVVAIMCALGVVLNSCTLPLHAPTALPNPAISLTLFLPASGEVFPIAQNIDLSADAGAAQSTIRTLTFLANGAPIAEGVAATGHYFHGTWLPPDSGEYYVQARVTLADGSTAISDPNRICVMPFGEPPPGALGPPGLPIGAGFTGPCELPTHIPNALTSGDLVVDAVVAPHVVQYGATGCFTPTQSVTFIAKVTDPQDLVVLVSEVMINAGASYQDREYLNWITTRAGNQKEYRRTIQLSPAFYGGNIQWYLGAFGRDGRQVGSDQGLIGYELLHCSQQPLIAGPSATTQVLQLSPSETPSALPPPTLTLQKNAFCRKGPDTSFPDVTAIVAGDTVDILNVSEDGFWYYIFWKQFNAKCWVAAGTGAANGDLSGLKVLVGPELPQPGVPPAAKKPTPAPPPCNPLIRVCP